MIVIELIVNFFVVLIYNMWMDDIRLKILILTSIYRQWK